MNRLLLFSLVVALLGLNGCGTGASFRPLTTGNLAFYNGATKTSRESVRFHVGRSAEDTWHVSPSKMTVTIKAIKFLQEGDDADDSSDSIPVTNCTATYDRASTSLIKLTDCAISVPTGTYVGVHIEYGTDYETVIDDPAGFYTDPAAPYKISTTAPAGGAQPVTLTDSNSNGGFSQMSTYFPTPLTVAEGTQPQVYVVFDPTHWLAVQLSGGQVAQVRTSGNPPIVPSASGFSRASFYSDAGTTLAYSGGSSHEFLIFYGDAETPVSLNQPESKFICSESTSAPNVAFNYNGLDWGTFGMLGRDAASSLISWALAGETTKNNTAISGYRGVLSLQEKSTIGDISTVSFKCTTDVPLPASGRVYSTAPTFTADDTFSVTLLAQ